MDPRGRVLSKEHGLRLQAAWVHILALPLGTLANDYLPGSLNLPPSSAQWEQRDPHHEIWRGSEGSRHIEHLGQYLARTRAESVSDYYCYCCYYRGPPDCPPCQWDREGMRKRQGQSCSPLPSLQGRVCVWPACMGAGGGRRRPGCACEPQMRAGEGHIHRTT